MPGALRWKVAVLAGAFLASVGCVHTQHGGLHSDAAGGIAVPPPGSVPRELEKVTLPPYVIEAPDQLLIEVVFQSKVKDENGQFKSVVGPLPGQAISGPFPVRPEGSVGLGIWGSVPVSGLTLDQAAEAIRSHVLKSETFKKFDVTPEALWVIVDVLAYNSKRYYVIFDGGGFGEQVFPFPVTGSETVLDAIGNLSGIPDVASKRNIWVARRTPHPGQPWQILPVDWIGITQHGVTATNYQVLPGDRIYVKAQRLVTIDRTLARIFSPVERVFGITLLGTSTINNIVGRGNGFGGNNN